VLSDSHTWLKGLNDFVSVFRTFLRALDEILHSGIFTQRSLASANVVTIDSTKALLFKALLH